MKRYHRLTACLASLFCAAGALAQNDPARSVPATDMMALTALFDEQAEALDASDTDHGGIKVYWENDGSFADPFDSYDRHYTNGIAFVFEHQPGWAWDAAEVLPFSERFDERHGLEGVGVGYLLGHQIYTPANLSATAPINTDHPYAGYLYGGAYLQREGAYEGREDVSVLDHFDINVGLVGEDTLAEDIQDYVHDTFTGVDPLGWDNQLANEVTAQVFYRRKWRIDLDPLHCETLGDLDMQLIPQAGIAVGTVHRYIDGGVVFRIGQQLPDDFGPGRINDPRSVTGDANALTGWSWYVYGRVGGRLVEHNLFIDGSNYEASVNVQRETAVGEVQGGFAVSYQADANNRLDLSWGLTVHTQTFDAPGSTGTNSYGTFVLAWVFTY